MPRRLLTLWAVACAASIAQAQRTPSKAAVRYTLNGVSKGDSSTLTHAVQSGLEADSVFRVVSRPAPGEPIPPTGRTFEVAYYYVNVRLIPTRVGRLISVDVADVKTGEVVTRKSSTVRADDDLSAVVTELARNAARDVRR